MSVPQRRKLTQAIKLMLEDVTGRDVGITTAPRDIENEHQDYPYIVLHPISGGLYGGPAFCGFQEDVTYDYQINAHGQQWDQAEWLADLVREAIIARDELGNLVNEVVFPNHKVMDQHVVGPTGKLENAGQIWTVQETFGFTVTSRV
jgi:hypothetical protein